MTPGCRARGRKPSTCGVFEKQSCPLLFPQHASLCSETVAVGSLLVSLTRLRREREIQMEIYHREARQGEVYYPLSISLPLSPSLSLALWLTVTRVLVKLYFLILPSLPDYSLLLSAFL